MQLYVGKISVAGRVIPTNLNIVKGYKMKLKQWLLVVVLGMMTTSVVAANDAEIKWPEPDSGWLKNGTFIDVEQLRRMGPEMTKDQVRELISYPQFSEGFLHPRTWNYLFNFRTGNGYEYVTCQYQVVFDKHERVESTHWRGADCVPNREVKPAVNQTRPVSLSSDGMFAFAKSGINDLQVPGQIRLRELANQIKTGFSNVRSISVTGHTDRIGSVQDNLALSYARAETAKRFLVNEGINGALITTDGVGSARPVVTCPAGATPAVINCLLPNRRIEVLVNGDK